MEAELLIIPNKNIFSSTFQKLKFYIRWFVKRQVESSAELKHPTLFMYETSFDSSGGAKNWVSNLILIALVCSSWNKVAQALKAFLFHFTKEWT